MTTDAGSTATDQTFTGKVAFITGAAGGIGQATAKPAPLLARRSP